MPELLWMAGKAFLIALILTPIVRDISRSLNVVDRPGQRKVHAYPMPRVGGIAIAIAYGVSLITFSGSNPSVTASLAPVWRLIPGAALVFLVGLLDDFFSLKPLIKILGLFAAANRGLLQRPAGWRIGQSRAGDLAGISPRPFSGFS